MVKTARDTVKNVIVRKLQRIVIPLGANLRRFLDKVPRNRRRVETQGTRWADIVQLHNQDIQEESAVLRGVSNGFNTAYRIRGFQNLNIYAAWWKIAAASTIIRG